ncbi:hypothetical protein VTO42DRAFT_8296 [Malbranchea cinnamomea]
MIFLFLFTRLISISFFRDGLNGYATLDGRSNRIGISFNLKMSNQIEFPTVVLSFRSDHLLILSLSLPIFFTLIFLILCFFTSLRWFQSSLASKENSGTVSWWRKTTGVHKSSGSSRNNRMDWTPAFWLPEDFSFLFLSTLKPLIVEGCLRLFSCFYSTSLCMYFYEWLTPLNTNSN